MLSTVGAMVASVGRISAGVGYDYLTKEVATSKHDYYAGHGEAPGVWAGRGLSALGLAGEVAAEDMAHLYGRFVDPRSAGSDNEVVLGQKVSSRTLHAGTPREKVLEPVAAFDVTFSPSKSVSALWAAATDEQVRSAVLDAHEAGVAAGLDYLEDNAGHGRAGKGGVRRVQSAGLVVAQFRHRTARSTQPGVRVGDPQIHSHCAILNRLLCEDGTWRTLDGQAIYRHAHAAGALYGSVFELELSRSLGVEWQAPAAGERVPMREIVGMPDSVRKQWSSRREQVLATYDRMVDKFRSTEHRSPTTREAFELRSRATVKSRLAKQQGNVELHAEWRNVLSVDELNAIDNLAGSVELTAITGGRLVAGSEQLGAAALQSLETQRSWWTRAHLFAEVAKLTDDPTRDSIELDVERIVAGCVNLEADTDTDYAQPDTTKFTSPRIIAAEQFVLGEASRDADWSIDAVLDPILGDDQVDAVEAVTSARSQVTTVIGPAGAGKTTLLQSVAESYKAAGRDIRVLALAANAAQVVTEETGIAATTIATWRVGGVDLPRNGLVIIDEASMVPTLTLRDLCRTAAFYNTRVALVGDYAQMGSPEAGGLLRDLSALDSASLMTTVRRFTTPWEGDASKRLRAHDADVATLYATKGRIKETTQADAIDSVADAWFTDNEGGNNTLVVADTITDAADVSGACQQRLLDAGHLGEHLGTAADSNPVHVGDLLQTRQNTNDLFTTDGHKVLNREVWQVTGLNTAGDIVAKHSSSNRQVAIKPEYLGRSVVLAYGTTLAGAQGRTVDRGHVLITPRTAAQSVYVGMTRGRANNTAHVITDGHDHEEFDLGDRSAVGAFADAIQRNSDGELSATTVATRWNTDTIQREAARSEDRVLDYATTFWTSTHRALPSKLRTTITIDPAAVGKRLSTIPNGEWPAILKTAIARTDWTKPDADTTFMSKLIARHARPPTSTMQPLGTDHRRTPQR
jgi:conjugative relaxase-like TrwC/TraI family protein